MAAGLEGGDSLWQVLDCAHLPRWYDQALWKQLLAGAFKLCIWEKERVPITSRGLNVEKRPAVSKALFLEAIYHAME